MTNVNPNGSVGGPADVKINGQPAQAEWFEPDVAEQNARIKEPPLDTETNRKLGEDFSRVYETENTEKNQKKKQTVFSFIKPSGGNKRYFGGIALMAGAALRVLNKIIKGRIARIFVDFISMIMAGIGFTSFQWGTNVRNKQQTKEQ